MTDERLRVGFVGCGGISRSLYTGMYAALCEMAEVVAVADLVDDLTVSRTRALNNAYLAEAHGARVAADNARTEGVRRAALNKAEAAQSAAANDIRRYRSHEELVADEQVQVVCVFTPPAIRMVPIVAAAEAGKLIANLDGDGRPDIVAAAERGSNEVRWWRNEGR